MRAAALRCPATSPSVVKTYSSDYLQAWNTSSAPGQRLTLALMRPVSQDDWLGLHEDIDDVGALASEEAMLAHGTAGTNSTMFDLPWAAAEVLVAVSTIAALHHGHCCGRLFRTAIDATLVSILLE